MIGKLEQELVDAATTLLNERYAPPVHSVAAALRTSEGKIISGINIDHFSGYVCAETSTLDEAINSKNYDYDLIVAVRMNDEGEVAVANMCGKCRQIFHDYAPKIKVIVSNEGELDAKTIEELLPYSFTRQQKKIQAVIRGGKT